MTEEILKHLYDIREAAVAIFQFVREKTFDDYEQDELLRSGVERKFEVIGEALNRIRRDDPIVLDKIRRPPMYRYELTDVQWEQIASFSPDRYHHGGAGHPWKEHRPLVNGILWRLHTGAPWPDLPERYGPWKTVYDRFNRWRKDATWTQILDALLLRLDKAGLIDRDLWLVDASVIRASRAAAGAKKKQVPQPTLAGPEAWCLSLCSSNHKKGEDIHF